MPGFQQPPRPTEIAHIILSRMLREGDHAVDATAGNGHDTLFLAQLVGPDGMVYAFDIQAAAIESARQRLTEAGLGSQVAWHHASHEEIERLVPTGNIAAVVFNLGYLPGADHNATTRTDSTLAALRAANQCLRPGGILSVLCYPGHPAGAGEARAIEEQWPEWAYRGWRIARYGLPFTRSASPVLWIASKP